MLSLLCSAPQLDASDGPGSPLASGSKNFLTSNSSTPRRKASHARRRMPSLSDVGAKLSSVTGSLKRREPPSAPSSATSSRFGKHGRTVSEAASTAGTRLGRKLTNASTRIRDVPIGAPMEFKHHFHLGPASNRTDTGTWDEERWRQVIEMRMNEEERKNSVIDLGPNTDEARSSAEERRAHRDAAYEMLSRGRPSRPPATDPALAGFGQQSLASRSTPALNVLLQSSSSSSSSSPGKSRRSTMNILAVPATGPGAVTGDENDATRAARAAKRASLVKRKPVPPLYPADEMGNAQTQTPPVPPVPVIETTKSRSMTTTSESVLMKVTEGSATPASAPAPASADQPKEVPLSLPPLQIPGFRSSLTPPAIPPRRRPVPIIETSPKQKQQLGMESDTPRPSLSLSTRSSSESSHQSSSSTVACESGGESETSEGSTETESAGPRTPTSTRALSSVSMGMPIEVSMTGGERDSVQALIAAVVHVADVGADSDADAEVALVSAMRDSDNNKEQIPSLDASESVYETADDGESQAAQELEKANSATLDALAAGTDADVEAEEETDARTLTDLPRLMKRPRAKTLPARRKRLSETLA